MTALPGGTKHTASSPARWLGAFLLGLLCAAPLGFSPASAASDAVEKAHIQQAVAAYARQQAAAAAQISDQYVAANWTALADDPSTPVLGNPRGTVTMVEFFDYACSYCKAIQLRMEALLRSDKGVKLAIKEFPILTPASMVAAKAALASVKQGKYGAFHNALMNYRGLLDDAAIFDTAKSVGLDVARLRRDMQGRDITDQIIANFNLARATRIFQTPGIIVGGHLLTGESADFDLPRLVAAARKALPDRR